MLGRHIPAGAGEFDALTVLDLLARHPATARFIATKLARRFVSDEPPPAVVERASRIFLDTDGNIRDVLAAILASPEFLSLDAYRAKIKSPLELVASAVRALGAVGVHAHEHTHGDQAHRHWHMHWTEAHADEDHGHRHLLRLGGRPFLVGLMHGMAGSAALMLLVLAAIPSPLAGLLYVLCR